MIEPELPVNNTNGSVEKRREKRYVRLKDMDIRLTMLIAVIIELIGVVLIGSKAPTTYHAQGSVILLPLSFLWFIAGLVCLLVPSYRKDKSAKEIKTGWILAIVFLAIAIVVIGIMILLRR
ncbi:MAG: hypothetical protein PHU42_01700 [Patescibacteria group bacterium]|nr:hypothetical protein [Patescibacteria group bacterium]